MLEHLGLIPRLSGTGKSLLLSTIRATDVLTGFTALPDEGASSEGI